MQERKDNARGQTKTTRAKKNKGQKAMQREKEKGKQRQIKG